MGLLAHGVFRAKKKAIIFSAVLMLTALAGAGFWVDYKKFLPQTKNAEKTGQTPENAKRDSIAAEAAKDSDGDGLKDWEEAVWGTDPQNPDSDKDKTTDGEEIAQGRDPLKKGPDDKISLQALKAGKAAGAETENNLTFRLAKNILESGAIEAIGPDGGITSTDFLKNVSLPEDMSAEALLLPSEKISVKSLKIVQANDAETVRQYFNALAAAYAKQPQVTSGKGDINIVAEAIASGDYSELAKLEVIASGLGRLADDIKKTAVPSAYADFALEELGYIVRTKRAVEILANAESDPLAAAIILPKRIELYQQIAELHRQTVSELKVKGIIFKPQENGYAYFR